MSADLLNKFTSHLKAVLTRALCFVVETGNETITPAHLLWSLGVEEGSVGSEILRKAGITNDALRAFVGASTKHDGLVAPTPEHVTPLLSDDAKHVLEKAILSAGLHEHRSVGTEHLLHGILAVLPVDINAFLLAEHVDARGIREQLKTVFTTTARFPDAPLMAPVDGARNVTANKNTETLCEECGHVHAKTDPHDDQASTALDYFTDDLTEKTTADDLDPCIGRDKEIERALLVLARRTKNNPLLLGEPGVGKTAIVEGLAKRIAAGDVPDALAGARLLRLDLAELVAGTMYRGDFENRLTQVIEDASEDADVILFIDEIHTIVGAGAASGSLDAANMLKPALARGDIRCIGATTLAEYKKHIEPDAALERRFAPIIVTEPSPAETRRILDGLATRYGKHHNVVYAKDALDEIITIAERHVQGRHFPDKAIDLLDETGAAVSISRKSSAEVRARQALERDLESIRKDKSFAVANEHFTEALELKQEEDDTLREIRELGGNAVVQAPTVLGANDVRRVAARVLGIPLERLTAEESDKLRALNARLATHVFGQTPSVGAVAGALTRAKLGFARANRPLASFLFAGPSGVGKTELARAVARELFDDHRALVRFDMSEYGESFGVSKLLGSPAGYVGFREGAKLTDAVRERPHAVILFDECEKAHRDVHNLLLQILDEGEITDATGRTVSFRNAVVILTTNAGRDAFDRRKVGFGESAKTTPSLADIRPHLEERFKPELLNRIDCITVFSPLSPATLAEITEKNLRELRERLKAQGISLASSNKHIAVALARRVTPKLGARDIHRVIAELVEEPFAKALLSETKHKTKRWKLAVDKRGKITIEKTK